MTQDRIWLKNYPEGVPADINPGQYRSLVGLMEESFKRYADRTAYSFMGKSVTYAQTDHESQAMAAYLQSLAEEISQQPESLVRGRQSAEDEPE